MSPPRLKSDTAMRFIQIEIAGTIATPVQFYGGLRRYLINTFPKIIDVPPVFQSSLTLYLLRSANNQDLAEIEAATARYLDLYDFPAGPPFLYVNWA